MKKVIVLLAFLSLPLAAYFLRPAIVPMPEAKKLYAATNDQALDVVRAAQLQTTYTRHYDPAYVRLAYPGGDVPLERGVCSDVVIRAFRAVGVDLQKEVHEDMVQDFGAYPTIWGLTKPDPNIDHRRVANLMTFFERKGAALGITHNPERFLPGDVVAWRLESGQLHIGIVSNETNSSHTRYLVLHNMGNGAESDDALFVWEIIGHYRYFRATAPEAQQDVAE